MCDGGSGWLVIDTGAGRPHIVPAYDLTPHEIIPGCWCEPDLTDAGWQHNSADGREDFESGKRKPM